MQLLIIRHGDAGDPEAWEQSGQPDEKRPISKKGRRQMKEGGRTIARLVPRVDLLAPSPFVRAQQTADVIARRFSVARRETTDTLVPDASPEGFVKWLEDQGENEVVAAVGHEPHLGRLITWLVAGLDESRVEMKKGGACLIEFEGRPERGRGTLLWLAGPKLLRR